MGEYSHQYLGKIMHQSLRQPPPFIIMLNQAKKHQMTSRNQYIFQTYMDVLMDFNSLDKNSRVVNPCFPIQRAQDNPLAG
ncbi:hypothetical protein BGZ63DRAFT_234035 [Mariannaea sp. PMI_226]|nr:hypothetical protein BGZ63DRAFT_234035 [Mariannaea sp. PMI_226]